MTYSWWAPASVLSPSDQPEITFILCSQGISNPPPLTKKKQPHEYSPVGFQTWYSVVLHHHNSSLIPVLRCFLFFYFLPSFFSYLRWEPWPQLSGLLFLQVKVDIISGIDFPLSLYSLVFYAFFYTAEVLHINADLGEPTPFHTSSLISVLVRVVFL